MYETQKVTISLLYLLTSTIQLTSLTKNFVKINQIFFFFHVF